MQTCGECNACCTSIPIAEPDFQKPCEQLCVWWVAGKRCSIYQNRPKPCKDFGCDYLSERVTGKHNRPDKLGVIFDSVIEAPQGKTLQVWEYHKDALKKPAVRGYMKKMLARGWFVITSDCESQLTLYLIDGRSPDTVAFTGTIVLGSTL